MKELLAVAAPYQAKNQPASCPDDTIDQLLDNVVVKLLVGDVVV